MADNNEQFVVTEKGLKEMESELEYLKTTKRAEIAEQIKVALGYGDLSENSEYDEAKQAQGFLEKDIRELEERINRAVVISEDEIQTDKISVGSVVRLYDFDDGEEIQYQIVGTAESDAKNNKISNASPVGKALIGHKVGDVVEVDVPIGKVSYEVRFIGR